MRLKNKTNTPKPRQVTCFQATPYHHNNQLNYVGDAARGLEHLRLVPVTACARRFDPRHPIYSAAPNVSFKTKRMLTISCTNVTTNFITLMGFVHTVLKVNVSEAKYCKESAIDILFDVDL